MNSEKNKIKLKLLCIVLIASILIQLVMPLISFADDSLSVELSSTATELKAGETINIDIYIKGGKISYFEGYLDYDTSLFEKISKSNIYPNSKLTADEDYGLWVKTFDEDAGNKISISESNGDSYDIPDNGLIGTIKLTLKADADTSKITFNNIGLVDENFEDIPIASVSVNVPAGATSKYTITYNPNTSDAVSNMPTSDIKTSGTDILIANAPSREGYTFTGWNTSADGQGTSYNAGDVYSTDADLQLYAQWEIITTTLTVNPNGGVWEGSSGTQTFTQDYGTTKTINAPTTTPNGYVVKFNATSNGGTTSILQTTQTTTFANWDLVGGGTLNGTTYTFSDTTATLTANYTVDSITLPDATKTGAAFKGWYTQVTGGTKVGGAGDSYTPTEAITLFAQWEDIDYTLTVNPNGGEWNGSTSNGNVQGKYNSTTTIADPTAPNGYTITFDNEGTITTETQTKTFARWTVVSGAGTISGSDYTFGAEDGEIIASYTENSVNLPQQTKTGYTFDGWYTQSTGGTKVGDAGDAYTPTENITLYAQYTANTYEITLDSNNGSAVTTKTVTYGEPYGTLPTPTKNGYDFDGWYDQSGNKITETDIVDITSDTTLTAQWLGAEYTVTLDPDGGTVSTTTITVRNEGKYGTLPDATKVGYTFKGWYNNNGDKIEATTIVDLTADETLTAQWEAIKTTLTVDPQGGTWEGDTAQQTFTQDYNTTKDIADPTEPNGYVVSFDCNGGDSNPSSLTQPVTFDNWTLTDGSTFVGPTYTFDITDETLTANYTRGDITLPDVTKTGATFKGWYTESTEGTKVGDAGDSYTPTADVTLYAQWEDIDYTLTVDPNGGEWNGSTNKGSVQGTYTSTTTIADPTATDGYTITLDNEGTITTEIQTKTFAGWTVVTGAGTISGSDYTFAAEDGEIIASYTENSVNLPQPTKTGYTFEGWYTESTGGTKVVDAGDSYTPTENITLYAQYTANTYQITFDPTDGTVDTPSTTVTYGQPYGTLPTPTKDGYDFDGWYDQNGNKITETDIVNITSDTTLTAQWIGSEYTVTFDYGDGTGSVQSKNVRNDETYGELPQGTKEGYTFVEWQDENGNKIESTTIVDLRTDITLYAVYEINKYTVTFQNDDGTVIDTVTVEHGEKVEYNGTTPVQNNTPAGYESTFAGWENIDKLDKVTEDTIIKATYTLTPIVYTITYENLNGNENLDNPTTYTIEDGTIQLVDLPDQEKIVFKGWYTTNDETGTKVTSIDTSKLENIILYAKWEEEKLYLKSQKYKVGENDIDIYEENDVYLDKIEPETTVAELINNCETNGTITVIDEQGNILGEDDLVGTNMTIKVTRYDEEITLTAVVMGDLDGNGKVTATDLSALNQTVLKLIQIDGAAFKAADLDDNEKITATDLSTENNAILKNITLTYTKPNKAETQD